MSTTFNRTVLGAGLALAATAGLAVVSTSSVPAATHTTTATLVATAAGGNSPLDAVPDPTGQTIYFTTDGPAGPGVFGVPAAGGAVRTILRGRPLVDPVGLVVSADGKRLFVADSGAGRILVVGVNGGRAHALRGSIGTRPRGLEVASQRIVFTGVNPATNKPGVFAVAQNGARQATVLAQGGQLRAPQGLAISGAGTVYVSDRGAGGPSDGRVLEIANNRIREIAGGIRLGNPAGLGLVADGSQLFVSSLAQAAGTAQVEIVNTQTFATGVFNDTIGSNTAAGGLHRGLRTSVMAWADVSRSGRVYRVDP